jgi:hypothetical protein
VNIQSGKEDIFSVATMLYARLRKINSRVIDVMYLMQNRSYAHHVITLALETKDSELAAYVERLRLALDLPDDQQIENRLPEESSVKAAASKHEEQPVTFSLF